MIRPTKQEAKTLARDFNVVPICDEIFADIKTTVEVLRNILNDNQKCYLLESVESTENWGRYSFLGYNPTKTIICNNGQASILENGQTKTVKTDNPNEILRRILDEYKSPRFDFMPPFTGGLVGYFSYDYIKYSHKNLVLDNDNTEGFDDCGLMLFDKVIAFDNLKQKIYIIANVKTDNFSANFDEACRQIEEMKKLIMAQTAPLKDISKVKSDFKLLYDEAHFIKMVEKIKKYIYEGDIFQAVISNRLEADFEGSLLEVYRYLRTLNPSPYMFYLNFGDLQLAGASPETLVTLIDGELTNYALAGTCPRGQTAAEDQALIEKLLADEKELAEHNMLVDLARNDLGKVSKFGTVEVREYKTILKFSHVAHLASVVSSKISPDCDRLDALCAVLPAGTLSGAPKHRACQIINELESKKRGPYGGAIGYIDFTGNMDTCIGIRMIVAKGGKAYVQSGAGIVADSDPKKEFQECRNKAQTCINAVLASGEGK
jgi:anthranilate synthase component 1